MQRHHFSIMVLLIMASLSLTACQRLTASPESAQAATPAAVEPSGGIHRVTLSAKTAERIGVKTAPVREAQISKSEGASTRRIVPYASVLYGLKNETWVYTTSQPLTYVRQAIAIDYIDGQDAVLLDGPPVGTAVVTTGAAELLGSDPAIRP